MAITAQPGLRTPHPRSRTRLWLFRSIAVILPFCLLLLLEGALRLFHYGYDSSLFIEQPHDADYLVFNPEAGKRYFTDQLNATTGNREPFRKTKAAGTLRLFVLGESTTIGYPYFHNGSFHRWLQYRLMRSFPDKKLEIVNISLTAVNSYTVLGFAREVVDYQPDAILIYTGHNEYYGALGVGSTNRLGSSPALINGLLWLRQFRVVQLLTQAWGKIARLFSAGASKAGKTRMELMVGDQQIGYGSPLFDLGLQQFKTNMGKTLELFHRRGIPVFLSNVVSNLRDQQPFVSLPVAGSGGGSGSIGDSGSARKGTGGLASMSTGGSASMTTGGSASDNFAAGVRAWAQGDYPTAKQAYTRAKDLDALRFRAPEGIDSIIDELSRQYDNTHLVDTRGAFQAASDHGIVGNSLLLEHVHPNLMGYALLSDVFFRALQQQGLIPTDSTHELGLAQLMTEMPITRVDSLTGAFKIQNLRNNWPFNNSGQEGAAPSRSAWHLTTEEEDLAYAVAFEHLPWEEAMRQLYDYYSKTEDWTKAASVMEALCLEHPSEIGWFDKTAMLYGKIKQEEKSIFYFREAFDREPSFDRARYLFVLCLQTDQPAAAIPYLDYAIANNSAGMNLQPVRADAVEIIRLETQLSRDSTNAALRDTIAHAYEHMGNKAAALKYQR
jgi:tetratricopeptide (TPR) repeat protein